MPLSTGQTKTVPPRKCAPCLAQGGLKTPQRSLDSTVTLCRWQTTSDRHAKRAQKPSPPPSAATTSTGQGKTDKHKHFGWDGVQDTPCRPVPGINGTRPWDKPRSSLGQPGRDSVELHSKIAILSHLFLGRVGLVPGTIVPRQNSVYVFCVCWFSFLPNQKYPDFLERVRAKLVQNEGLEKVTSKNITSNEKFSELTDPWLSGQTTAGQNATYTSNIQNYGRQNSILE